MNYDELCFDVLDVYKDETGLIFDDIVIFYVTGYFFFFKYDGGSCCFMSTTDSQNRGFFGSIRQLYPN